MFGSLWLHFSKSLSHSCKSKFFRLISFILLTLTFLSLTGCLDVSKGMLNPKGIITFQERKLFFDTLALMLIVVLPVIVMSIAFIYHYQISHRVTDYKPNWGHSHLLEAMWWGIPCVIIVILAVLTWKKTYELDPYAPIQGSTSTQPPMVIQAIALPWKWLFVYPAQGVATLNYLVLPLGQQVEVQMTTDNVPMSAFFVPQIGSQIYAMAGMRTKMHMIANEIGAFEGLNTQFNGDGFSDMHFQVYVVNDVGFGIWLKQAKAAKLTLDDATYTAMVKPSIGDQPHVYKGASKDLFDRVLALYMNSYGPTHPRATPQTQYSAEQV